MNIVAKIQEILVTAKWVWDRSLIKRKFEMGLFVNFCVFTRSYLFLSVTHLKLYWRSKQNNFEFTTQRWVKIHKSANNRWSRYKQKWVEKVQSYNGEWSERLKNDDKTKDTYVPRMFGTCTIRKIEI